MPCQTWLVLISSRCSAKVAWFVLLVTSKQKLGRKGKVYTMEEVLKFMEEDLKTRMSVSQAKSSMPIATKLSGLKVGNSYTVKDQPSSRAWVLHGMNDKDVALLQFPLLEPTKKLEMKFKEDEVHDSLKANKSKLKSLVAPKALDASIPSNNEICILESQKAALFLALTNAYSQWALRPLICSFRIYPPMHLSSLCLNLRKSPTL